jgi:hypothetical protein
MAGGAAGRHPLHGMNGHTPHGGPSHRSNVMLATLMDGKPGEPEWENAWAHATPGDKLAYRTAQEARLGELHRLLDEMRERWPGQLPDTDTPI